MATVKIAFSGGNVPILMGPEPPSKDMPIENPVAAGGNTNISFFAVAGEHCYTLKTSIPHTPLWLKGTAIDGVPLRLKFDVKNDGKNMLEMG